MTASHRYRLVIHYLNAWNLSSCWSILKKSRGRGEERETEIITIDHILFKLDTFCIFDQLHIPHCHRLQKSYSNMSDYLNSPSVNPYWYYDPHGYQPNVSLPFNGHMSGKFDLSVEASKIYGYVIFLQWAHHQIRRTIRTQIILIVSSIPVICHERQLHQRQANNNNIHRRQCWCGKKLTPVEVSLRKTIQERLTKMICLESDSLPSDNSVTDSKPRLPYVKRTRIQYTMQQVGFVDLTNEKKLIRTTSCYFSYKY